MIVDLGSYQVWGCVLKLIHYHLRSITLHCLEQQMKRCDCHYLHCTFPSLSKLCQAVAYIFSLAARGLYLPAICSKHQKEQQQICKS
jgi:hypothetical protein